MKYWSCAHLLSCRFDEILVCSRDEQEHLAHLISVLSRLNNYNVKINVKKSFYQMWIPFLEFILSPEGIHPQREKVDALLNAVVPTSVVPWVS
jgi:hypothetical protein